MSDQYGIVEPRCDECGVRAEEAAQWCGTCGNCGEHCPSLSRGDGQCPEPFLVEDLEWDYWESQFAAGVKPSEIRFSGQPQHLTLLRIDREPDQGEPLRDCLDINLYWKDRKAETQRVQLGGTAGAKNRMEFDTDAGMHLYLTEVLERYERQGYRLLLAPCLMPSFRTLEEADQFLQQERKP